MIGEDIDPWLSGYTIFWKRFKMFTQEMGDLIVFIISVEISIIFYFFLKKEKKMKFRKKPVVIEAMKFILGNEKEIEKFIGNANLIFGIGLDNKISEIGIPTLEGTMTANLNDWIIKGVKGEFYPIKNDIFIETYEPVAE